MIKFLKNLLSSSVIGMTFVSAMSRPFSNKIQKQVPTSHSTIVPSIVNFTRIFFTFKKNKAKPLCSSFLRVHDDADADSARERVLN